MKGFDIMKDLKLKKFLLENGVENVDNVRTIHLFGIVYDDDVVLHHSVNCFDELYDYIHEFDYQRVMIIFKNGGSVAWDTDPDYLRKELDNIVNMNILTTTFVN